MADYHKIIPERVALLAMFKGKVHHQVQFAERTLKMVLLVINPKLKDTIMITAGCHGNEPAPVYAMAQFFKRKRFPKFRLVIVPCVNPFGFVTHRDANEQRKDINLDFFSKKPQPQTRVLKALVRRYKPRFVLNLHEDPDEKKFFIYVEGDALLAGKKILDVVGLPHYKNYRVHRDLVQDGMVINGRRMGALEDFCSDLGVANICVETPGIMDFETRVKAHIAILNNLDMIVKTG